MRMLPRLAYGLLDAGPLPKPRRRRTPVWCLHRTPDGWAREARKGARGTRYRRAAPQSRARGDVIGNAERTPCRARNAIEIRSLAGARFPWTCDHDGRTVLPL